MLKRDVFRRLQLSVPAPLAKKRVQDVLDALEQLSLQHTEVRDEHALLASLEASAKRFNLYFDWPQAQKLRALLGVTRAEMAAGNSVPALLDGGTELVAALERRLSEGLAAQAGDLAELQAEVPLLAGDGAKLRRLEGLIAQIGEAQRQGVLSLGEVERARHVALNLRKLVESAMPAAVSPADTLSDRDAPDPSSLTTETRRRLSELDRAGEARDLDGLASAFEPLLRARADLADQLAAARARAAAGEVLGASVAGLRERLGGELSHVLALQRAELDALAARLGALNGGEAGGARLALEVARGTLQGGALATDELAELDRALRILEGPPGEPETGELDRARAGLDARADAVGAAYGRYRHLAGDTIQQLGRLADDVRRARRAGELSGAAMGRYAEQLGQAEALLGAAHAEFEAARELTGGLGAGDLEQLLGVFDISAPTPPAAEPLAPALDSLAAHAGARLALLRAGAIRWGDVDPASLDAAQQLASLSAHLGEPRLISLELERGGLLALPLPGALLIARVEDAAALAAWRERLLGARAALA